MAFLRFEQHVCHTSSPSFLKLPTQGGNPTWKSHWESRHYGPTSLQQRSLAFLLPLRESNGNVERPSVLTVRQVPATCCSRQTASFTSTFRAPSIPPEGALPWWDTPSGVPEAPLKLHCLPCFPVSQHLPWGRPCLANAQSSAITATTVSVLSKQVQMGGGKGGRV